MKVSQSAIAERHQAIYAYLLENRSATVDQLSELMSVSPLTIRRDLTAMEEHFAIERFHGGARIKRNAPPQLPPTGLFSPEAYAQLFEPLSEVRERLARKAAEFIDYEDTIFINSSTTVLGMMKYIGKDNRISVVTNNALMPFVKGLANAHVLLTGGQIYEHTFALVGENATQTISKVRASKCVLGVHGISAASGITTLNYQQSEINEKMVSMCNGTVIVVAEGKKIGRSLSFISCDITKIDVLITDSTANAAEVQQLIEAGVDVIIADRQ